MIWGQGFWFFLVGKYHTCGRKVSQTLVENFRSESITGKTLNPQASGDSYVPGGMSEGDRCKVKWFS
jgi:hypothetical protein